MKDYFISYARHDENLAIAIARLLKVLGKTVWLDLYEIKSGTNEFLAIRDGIKDSRQVILLLSESYGEGEWPLLESLSFQRKDLNNRKRTIIPVLLDGTAIPEYLANFHAVDYRDDRRPFNKVVEEIIG